MLRPVVVVFAVVVMLALASEATATVGGPCTAEINGEDIGPREVGATSDPVVVSNDRPGLGDDDVPSRNSPRGSRSSPPVLGHSLDGARPGC